MTNNNCPCHSGLNYDSCCRPFHEGKALPATALLLMRSRYAAYALSLADYIQETTHPDYQESRSKAQWRKEIELFSQHTDFQGLTILEHREEGDRGWVTFIAELAQDGRDCSFQERSYFERVRGRWLYLRRET